MPPDSSLPVSLYDNKIILKIKIKVMIKLWLVAPVLIPGNEGRCEPNICRRLKGINACSLL